jgi:DNA-binding MarR family transcriptional regulator
LSTVAYCVLNQVEAVPHTRATDLADLFGLDKSTVSRQLDQLEGAGLLRREGERSGRRGSVLATTSAGRGRLESANARARRRLKERLEGWEERDLVAFASLSERFNQDFFG